MLGSIPGTHADSRGRPEPTRVTEPSAAAIRVLFVEGSFDEALQVRGFLEPLDSLEITHTPDGNMLVGLAPGNAGLRVRTGTGALAA